MRGKEAGGSGLPLASVGLCRSQLGHFLQHRSVGSSERRTTGKRLGLDRGGGQDQINTPQSQTTSSVQQEMKFTKCHPTCTFLLSFLKALAFAGSLTSSEPLKVWPSFRA